LTAEWRDGRMEVQMTWLLLLWLLLLRLLFVVDVSVVAAVVG